MGYKKDIHILTSKLTDFEIKVNDIYYNILDFLIYEYPIHVDIMMFNVNLTNYLFLICYFHDVLKTKEFI